VLLIGAGEMAELAVEHLLRHPVAETFVANRTFENGLALARRFNGQAIRFERSPSTSNGRHHHQLHRCPGFVITRDDVKRIIRAARTADLFHRHRRAARHRPRHQPAGQRLCLRHRRPEGAIEENIEDRQKEAIKGERIIDEATVRFGNGSTASTWCPPSSACAKNWRPSQRPRSSARCTATHVPGDAQALSRMMGAFINKMLHDPPCS